MSNSGSQEQRSQRNQQYYSDQDSRPGRHLQVSQHRNITSPDPQTDTQTDNLFLYI